MRDARQTVDRQSDDLSASSVYERHHGEYLISDDTRRFDVDAFAEFLQYEAYWARGRSPATTAVAVSNSIVLGVYAPDGEMVGATRIVTDRATFGWLCDVYLLGPFRGQGLGRALVTAACEHPALSTVKRVLLITADAHGFYSQLGFASLSMPERWMERTHRPPKPTHQADPG